MVNKDVYIYILMNLAKKSYVVAGVKVSFDGILCYIVLETKYVSYT